MTHLSPTTLRLAIAALGLLAAPMLALAAGALNLLYPGVIHHG